MWSIEVRCGLSRATGLAQVTTALNAAEITCACVKDLCSDLVVERGPASNTHPKSCRRTCAGLEKLEITAGSTRLLRCEVPRVQSAQGRKRCTMGQQSNFVRIVLLFTTQESQVTHCGAKKPRGNFRG